MPCKFKEPDLNDVFEDPIVRAVMMRDAVEEGDLRRLIDQVRDTLGDAGRPPASAFAPTEACIG
jgi:hypothetical protein